MQRLFLLISILAFLEPAVAMAKKPDSRSLAEHQQKKEALEREIQQIEQDLSGTRNEMVSLGKSIQENEKTLQNLEERITELEKQKTEKKAILSRNRKSMADLILALERIRRVPPEAMIARPEAPFKTAQSVLLMGNIIPSLYNKADELRKNLEELDKITSDLKKKREVALKTSISLEQEHKKLAGLVDKREKLFADTHANLQAEKETVELISRQARNLADLVSKLDENKKKQHNAAFKAPAVHVPSGQARLPVSGIIRTRYNDPDEFGAPSRGISIASRPGALVVAPLGGVVRFAGPFKNYGNIVILEHQNGYHSLIAGLEKIDTVVGQSVSAGEALGLLHRVQNPGEKPALYYELRLNGRPVNPAEKFADLG